jgi:cytochrome c oxidase subunit 1
MFTFVFGGITGLINASYTVNQVVHNTAWVPGHFHMTVGSAVALTLMGVAYWLIPYLTGRELWGRRIALAQVWIYAIGVLVMARGLISGGLEGMPRRTFMAEATYSRPGWELAGTITAVGGSLMTLGAVLFFVVLVGTVLNRRRDNAPKDIPWGETLNAPARTGWEPNLDRLGLWLIVAVILVIIAYAPFAISYLPPNLVSPGFRMY